MRDVPVPEVLLDRPRVLTVVRQFESGGVAQHVWMHGERHSDDAGDDLADPGRGERPLALGCEHVGPRVFSPNPPQRPKLPASKRLYRRRAVLESIDVDRARTQVHLVPSERHEFGDAQTVAIGQQQHARVPVPVPPGLAGRSLQGGNFGRCQVFAAPDFNIRSTDRRRPFVTFPFTDTGALRAAGVRATTLADMANLTFP